MDSTQKTRYLIGGLGAAVLILLIYAVTMDRGKVTPPPPGQAQATAPAAEPPTQTQEGSFDLFIETDASVVGGSKGHDARLRCSREVTAEWSIVGGELEGNAKGEWVTWTAGKAREAVLTCAARDAEGNSARAVVRIPVTAPGQIARFEADPPVISLGSTSRLQWQASGAKRVVLDPGGREFKSDEAPSFEVKPTETTRYTLSLTDASGAVTTREATVKVVPLPQISSFRADPVSGDRREFRVTAVFSGGKAELKQGDAVLATAESGPIGLTLSDPAPGMELQLRVTSEAGAYITSRLIFPGRP
nr:hypothetical protein [uncultured Holophaga sp.]